MATNLKIQNARAAFVELGAPAYYQGTKQSDRDQRKWRVALIVTPDTTVQTVTGFTQDGKKIWGPAQPGKSAIDAAVQMTARAKWGEKASGYLLEILPNAQSCCWTDGNRKPDYQGYPGNWVLATNRPEDKGRPGVIDADMSPLFQANNEPFPGKAGRIYGGCYVNATVELYTYDKPKKGISCGLNTVQFLKAGDSFGGGAPANPEDFDDISEGAGAASLC